MAIKISNLFKDTQWTLSTLFNYMLVCALQGYFFSLLSNHFALLSDGPCELQHVA